MLFKFRDEALQELCVVVVGGGGGGGGGGGIGEQEHLFQGNQGTSKLRTGKQRQFLGTGT